MIQTEDKEKKQDKNKQQDWQILKTKMLIQYYKIQYYKIQYSVFLALFSINNGSHILLNDVYRRHIDMKIGS